jgi:DnaJ-class molecular chaperone
MGRSALILAILIGAALLVRHQFHTVIHKVTTKSPHRFPTSDQESRRKCVICGGTGRVASFRFGTPNSAGSDLCHSCNGTGWIDNPLFQR